MSEGNNGENNASNIEVSLDVSSELNPGHANQVVENIQTDDKKTEVLQRQDSTGKVPNSENNIPMDISCNASGIYLDPKTKAQTDVNHQDIGLKFGRKNKRASTETIPDVSKNAKSSFLAFVNKKKLFYTVILLIAGITAFALGIMYAIKSKKASKGAALWVIGLLCAIPSSYYVVKMYRAASIENEEDRNNALKAIP